MARKLITIFTIFVIAILASGCHEKEILSVVNAEAYLEAISAGNSDDIEKYSCGQPDTTLTGFEELMSVQVSEGITFSGISCQEEGMKIICNFTINQDGTYISTAMIRFTMLGDLVCGISNFLQNY